MEINVLMNVTFKLNALEVRLLEYMRKGGSVYGFMKDNPEVKRSTAYRSYESKVKFILESETKC